MLAGFIFLEVARYRVRVSISHLVGIENCEVHLRHNSDITNQATDLHLGLNSSLGPPFYPGVQTLKQKFSLGATDML